jgi:DMSO reductase anchor subunit
VLRAEAATGSTLVPGAPSSSITIPSTEYRSSKGRIDDVLAADRFAVKPAHAHDPLTVMLVLTQLSVGAFVVGLLVPGTSRWGTAVAMLTGLLALAASVLHLGRPQYAWRAVIGLRHSWLSREVIAFGAFAGAAVPYALLGIDALAPVVAACGLLGVFCSVQLYARTRRRWWRTSATTFRFGMSMAVSGTALELLTTGERVLAGWLIAATGVKLLWELSDLRHRRGDGDLAKTAQLLRGELRHTLLARVVLGLAGGVVVPLIVLAGAPVAALGLLLVVAAELLERRLFFMAVAAPRMPGIA